MEANPPERMTFLCRTTDITQCYINRTTDITQCYINVNGYYTMLHTCQPRTHSLIRTPDSFLIDFLPDRFLTGPAIPRVVSHQNGDYGTTCTNLLCHRAVHADRDLPECQYYPNWAPTDTPGLPIRPHYRPAGYSRPTLSVHEFTIT